MNQVRQFVGLPALGLAALVGFSSGSAQAAPQALALVATQGPVTLTCSASECTADLTSFCLDETRSSPSPGTAYMLASDGPVRLTVRTGDGRTVSVDVKAHARFESRRHHFAVQISVPRTVLEAHGTGRADVEVAANAALLPVPVPGDPNGIGNDEAALLTGSMRQLGSQIVDEDPAHMQASRVASRMINQLRSTGDGDAPDTEVLWTRAFAASDGNLSTQARKMARGSLDMCSSAGGINRPDVLRRCLQDRHDRMIGFLNGKYWQAAKKLF